MTNIPPTQMYTNYTFVTKSDSTRELRATDKVNVPD